MTDQELQLLCQWLKENGEHKITFLEKEAVKVILKRADTVNDLVETALKLLKGKE